jgi:hypothetical protein
MKISTASGKAKGRRLQQLVRDKILETYPTLGEGDVVSTSMGAGGEDVKLSPAARRLFPYSVECKARATLPLYAWYTQAKSNAPPDAEPMLVIKQDRNKPLVVVDLDHYFELLEKL